MTANFAPHLLARIETAGLNASAPPQQSELDGWLIRLSPGKAKRTRCVNAIRSGSMPLAQLLARCAQVFDEAGLPLIIRITPFTQPVQLDQYLAEMGLVRFDDTRVMVLEDLTHLTAPQLPPGLRIVLPNHEQYAQAVGQLRGSSAAQIDAQAHRLRDSAVPYVGVLWQRDGLVAACGQYALEDDLVGLYDVFVSPAERGQSLSRHLCAQMLLQARDAGAKHAYLQVEGDNHPARRTYAHLGFVDGYAYHYRCTDPSTA